MDYIAIIRLNFLLHKFFAATYGHYFSFMSFIGACNGNSEPENCTFEFPIF